MGRGALGGGQGGGGAGRGYVDRLGILKARLVRTGLQNQHWGCKVGPCA